MNKQVSRRDVLKWAVAALVALSTGLVTRAMARFLMPPVTHPAARAVNVPDARAMRVGEVRYVPAARAYLVRGRDGFYALSAVCTHLGCLVNHKGNGFQCPCHGSRFDTRGMNLSGPAPRPLPRLAVRWDGDALVLVPQSP